MREAWSNFFGGRMGCESLSLSRSASSFIMFLLFFFWALFATAPTLSFVSNLWLVISNGCYINIAGRKHVSRSDLRGSELGRDKETQRASWSREIRKWLWSQGGRP
jgi:hypothetical protein